MKKILLSLFFLLLIPSYIYAQSLEMVIDDFEDNNLWTPEVSLGWWHLDNSYEYKILEDRAYEGKSSMHITYYKTKPYQLLAGQINEENPKKDFSKYDTLSLMVYGLVKLLLKLEDFKGGEGTVGIKTALAADQWNRLDFDLSNLKIDKTNIKNIFLFFAPSDIGVKGEVFLDKIFLYNKRLSKDKNYLNKINKQEQEILQRQKRNAIHLKTVDISVVCPFDFDFDNQNNIYVVQKNSGFIFKYNEFGEFVTEIGRFGSKIGEFNNPVDIEFVSDKSSFYVVDRGNKRVQKFYINGKIDKTFANNGELIYKNKDIKFEDIVDLTIDNDNNIYILEKKDKKVYKYNENGEFISIFCDDLVEPVKVRFFNDFIFVIDAGTCIIKKLDLSGKLLASLKCVDAQRNIFIPKDIAFESKSCSYFIISSNRKDIIVYDKNWNYIGKTDFFKLNMPNAVSFRVDEQDKFSIMYVADLNKNKIFFTNILRVKTDIV
jgi:hypothetical protein